MTVRQVLIVFGIAGPLCVVPLAGQTALERGATLRVTSAELADWSVIGSLLNHTPTTLTLLAHGDTLHVSTASVSRLELQSREGRGTLRGAFLGAVVGFVAGIAVQEETADRFPIDVSPRYYGTGAVLGSLLGGLIGRQFPTRQWSRVTVAPRPGAGGAGALVRVALPF